MAITSAEQTGIAIKLRLSAQRALWGRITPRVRAVFASISGHEVVLRFVYEAQPGSEEADLASEAGAELIADFPEPYTVRDEIQVASIPGGYEHSGHLIYQRYESAPPNNSLQARRP